LEIKSIYCLYSYSSRHGNSALPSANVAHEVVINRLTLYEYGTPITGSHQLSHAKNIVHCSGPHEPHALHGIPMQPRRGDLDALCPACAGHGQWNSEIDLVSQRSKRQFCGTCGARGWIETGDDLVSSHDIVMTEEGHPKWVVRLDPPSKSG
jgi:hypothetical protein